MRTIYSHDKFVAMISKQSKDSPNYNREEPWLLLHNTGRTDRFESFQAAREEAIKSFPAVTFKIEGTP